MIKVEIITGHVTFKCCYNFSKSSLKQPIWVKNILKEKIVGSTLNSCLVTLLSSKKYYWLKIGYHNFNPECKRVRGFIDYLYTELGHNPRNTSGAGQRSSIRTISTRFSP